MPHMLFGRPVRLLAFGSLLAASVALALALAEGGAQAAADSPCYVTGTTCYVSTSGQTDNPGTMAAPWNLQAANDATLSPGDQVLFESGDTFLGELVVHNSGSVGDPITFGAYGSGSQPVIMASDGSTVNTEALLVQDQSDLKFDGLTFENPMQVQGSTNSCPNGRTPPADTVDYGALVESVNAPVSGVTFDGDTFTDVYPNTLETDAFCNRVAELMVMATNPNPSDTIGTSTSPIVAQGDTFDNGNRFGAVFETNTGGSGYNVQDVEFENNTCTDTGGSCALASQVENYLLQDNTIVHSGDNQTNQFGGGSGAWFIQSKNVVAQGNTVEDSSSAGETNPHDTAGIHVDAGNTNVLVQHNFAYNNDGYGLEILGGNNNVIVRYNVSVNDGWRTTNGALVHISSYLPYKPGTALSNDLQIYNNTYVINSPPATTDEAFDVSATNSDIYNNIFAALGSNKIGPGKKSAGSSFTSWDNLFYNTSLDSCSTSNTCLEGCPAVLPTPTTGVGFTGGPADQPSSYMLASDSPAVGNGSSQAQPSFPAAGQGIFANVNGTALKDYFKDEVPTGSTELNDIGAYNPGPGGIGTGPTPCQ